MKPFICACCLDHFELPDLAEWDASKEAYLFSDPFLCPDCYDDLMGGDLEEQLIALLEGDKDD